jgi:hypothetical protein
MRLLLPLLSALTVVVCIGSILAQDDDEDIRKKRLTELQKEIHELHKRIEKLSAEAATLQPVPEKPVVRIKDADSVNLGLQSEVFDLRFSPDDRLLFWANWSPRMQTYTYERRFSLWDVKTMSRVGPILKRDGVTNIFEFDGKTERVALAGQSEYAIQNMRSGDVIYSLPPPKDWRTFQPDPAPLWISPDGETYLLRHYDLKNLDLKFTRLQTIRARTGKVEHDITVDGSFPVIAPDGRTVFTFAVEEYDSGRDSKGKRGKDYRAINSATAWNIADGKKRFTIDDKDRKKPKEELGYDLSKDTTPPQIIAFSPDGKRFLWFHDGARFHVGDLASGETLYSLPRIPFQGHLVAFSRDGRMLALNGSNLTLWEIATGKQRHWYPEDGNCILFSHDGSLLAAGGTASVALWDVWGTHAAKSAGPLSAKAIERDWNMLADADAEKAFRAMRRLVQHPSQSAPLIKERVQAYLKNTKSAEISALIRDLDSNVYRVRQAAEQELRQLGAAARPVLSIAIKSATTLEGRRRAELILQGSDTPPTGGYLQTMRAIEVLEAIPGDGASAALKSLASNDPLHPLTIEARASLDRRIFTARSRD